MKFNKWLLKEEQGKGTGREGVGGTDTCICPECGYEESHKERGVPCDQSECPKCGCIMTGKGAPGEIK